ncbi:hypothetical protein GZH46_00190 [Fragariocoptes setiger]|uniref:Uncharacterized protein n=1 Tax=Fragariocoptes setiger TaxID=1670756 RepID=A0ABQ7SCX7_9ACAR|nr:hypothetical protein GZH46_00190 [Fragariocoptes setiger]
MLCISRLLSSVLFFATLSGAIIADNVLDKATFGRVSGSTSVCSCPASGSARVSSDAVIESQQQARNEQPKVALDSNEKDNSQPEASASNHVNVAKSSSLPETAIASDASARQRQQTVNQTEAEVDKTAHQLISGGVPAFDAQAVAADMAQKSASSSSNASIAESPKAAVPTAAANGIARSSDSDHSMSPETPSTESARSVIVEQITTTSSSSDGPITSVSRKVEVQSNQMANTAEADTISQSAEAEARSVTVDPISTISSSSLSTASSASESQKADQVIESDVKATTAEPQLISDTLKGQARAVTVEQIITSSSSEAPSLTSAESKAKIADELLKTSDQSEGPKVEAGAVSVDPTVTKSSSTTSDSRKAADTQLENSLRQTTQPIINMPSNSRATESTGSSSTLESSSNAARQESTTTTSPTVQEPSTASSLVGSSQGAVSKQTSNELSVSRSGNQTTVLTTDSTSSANPSIGQVPIMSQLQAANIGKSAPTPSGSTMSITTPEQSMKSEAESSVNVGGKQVSESQGLQSARSSGDIDVVSPGPLSSGKQSAQSGSRSVDQLIATTQLNDSISAKSTQELSVAKSIAQPMSLEKRESESSLQSHSNESKTKNEYTVGESKSESKDSDKSTDTKPMGLPTTEHTGSSYQTVVEQVKQEPKHKMDNNDLYSDKTPACRESLKQIESSLNEWDQILYKLGTEPATYKHPLNSNMLVESMLRNRLNSLRSSIAHAQNAYKRGQLDELSARIRAAGADVYRLSLNPSIRRRMPDLGHRARRARATFSAFRRNCDV